MFSIYATALSSAAMRHFGTLSDLAAYCLLNVVLLPIYVKPSFRLMIRPLIKIAIRILCHRDEARTHLFSQPFTDEGFIAAVCTKPASVLFRSLACISEAAFIFLETLLVDVLSRLTEAERQQGIMPLVP